MRLTITISNWNRDWFLDRSVYLISKQTLSQDDWELVVVDDGSIDETDKIVNRYKNMGIIKNFHYIKRIKKREKYGNCAIARNIGAKFGSGDYILFTDPEVMPLPDWAERHYLAHREKIMIRSGSGMYIPVVIPESMSSKDLAERYSQKEEIDRNVIGYCLQPREYHAVTENCKGPILGNAYTDYDWFDIVNNWKIMNGKIKEVQNKYDISNEIIRSEFFIYQATQAGHSVSRKLFFDLRGFEENFADASIGLDKWSGEDTWFHVCLDRVKSKRIELPSARAIHIYHNKVCHNYDAANYAHKYAKEHPGQWESNLNREWGQIEENSFKIIF